LTGTIAAIARTNERRNQTRHTVKSNKWHRNLCLRRPIEKTMSQSPKGDAVCFAVELALAWNAARFQKASEACHVRAISVFRICSAVPCR